ncbi:hypothetical protein Q3G72_000443 [Acer saccharum]|nr:hypothetical protein Q3G72_000443 [Acer saccharum]
MEKSSSIDNIKLEVIEVQSSDVETKLGGVMTATTDSSPIDIKIGGTPMTNNEKPKIESLWCNLPDNENLLKLYQDCYDLSWHVWQFNEAEKVWCELENLGNRMLFVSTATLTSLQLARSAKEEDREGMVSFANTVHVAHGYPPQLDYDETLHLGEKRGLFANAIQVEHSTYIPQLECSSPIYKTPDEHHPSIPQVENSSLIYMIPDDYYLSCQQIYEIYNWIDYEGLGLTWIQPPQIR